MSQALEDMAYAAGLTWNSVVYRENGILQGAASQNDSSDWNQLKGAIPGEPGQPKVSQPNHSQPEDSQAKHQHLFLDTCQIHTPMENYYSNS